MSSAVAIGRWMNGAEISTGSAPAARFVRRLLRRRVRAGSSGVGHGDPLRR
jgi:hypothetical protein